MNTFMKLVLLLTMSLSTAMNTGYAVNRSQIGGGALMLSGFVMLYAEFMRAHSLSAKQDLKQQNTIAENQSSKAEENDEVTDEASDAKEALIVLGYDLTKMSSQAQKTASKMRKKPTWIGAGLVGLGFLGLGYGSWPEKTTSSNPVKPEKPVEDGNPNDGNGVNPEGNLADGGAGAGKKPKPEEIEEDRAAHLEKERKEKKQKAEEARLAEERRKAEEARLAEEREEQEEVRKAEAARKAAEKAKRAAYESVIADFNKAKGRSIFTLNDQRQGVIVAAQELGIKDYISFQGLQVQVDESNAAVGAKTVAEVQKAFDAHKEKVNGSKITFYTLVSEQYHALNDHAGEPGKTLLTDIRAYNEKFCKWIGRTYDNTFFHCRFKTKEKDAIEEDVKKYNSLVDAYDDFSQNQGKFASIIDIQDYNLFAPPAFLSQNSDLYKEIKVGNQMRAVSVYENFWKMQQTDYDRTVWTYTGATWETTGKNIHQPFNKLLFRVYDENGKSSDKALSELDLDGVVQGGLDNQEKLNERYQEYQALPILHRNNLLALAQEKRQPFIDVVGVYEKDFVANYFDGVFQRASENDLSLFVREEIYYAGKGLFDRKEISRIEGPLYNELRTLIPAWNLLDASYKQDINFTDFANLVKDVCAQNAGLGVEGEGVRNYTSENFKNFLKKYNFNLLQALGSLVRQKVAFYRTDGNEVKLDSIQKAFLSAIEPSQVEQQRDQDRDEKGKGGKKKASGNVYITLDWADGDENKIKVMGNEQMIYFQYCGISNRQVNTDIKPEYVTFEEMTFGNNNIQTGTASVNV